MDVPMMKQGKHFMFYTPSRGLDIEWPFTPHPYPELQPLELFLLNLNGLSIFRLNN